MTMPMEGWETYTDPLGNAWPSPSTGAPPEVASFIQNTIPQAPAPAPAPHTTAPAAPALGTPEGMAAALEAPADPRGMADRAGAGAPEPPPDPRGAADRAAQPSMIPVTTTESTTTTSGVDKKSEAGIRSATDQANQSAQAAGQAEIDERKAAGALEAKQAQDAYGRGVNTYFEQAVALQVQDDVIQETSKRLEETAKFKPDRTALFKGDKGALFGISAGIAAMAGGFLMGLQGGGKNPYLDAILGMVDDNARDQIESNSLVYQELTKRLGSAEAAKRELKARMLGAVNDTIEAQARFEKSELVQKGSAGVMARVQAEQAKNNLEREKLVARNVQTSVQRKSQMIPNIAATGGIDISDPKEYARVGKVQAVTNFAADVESLAKTGELAASVGLLDEAWDWASDAVRARSPGAAKVDALKAKWELMMRSDWASEPNGQETQRRLSSISFPRSDAEIPLFQQNVREAVNAVDPGGRYRIAARAMGNTPKATETGRTPIVRK
jgi:hypothetical protein